MVCESCEKKQGSLVTPDVWKQKEKGKSPAPSGSGVGPSRRISENKLLSAKNRFTPYEAKCKICKSPVTQGHTYCQGCAYKKGICSMCGKLILDVKMYKQSMK
eukprot:TRINITY_DN4188_c0_g1_i1.p1 TRINITY_DN4188_c0_g1~~TRINITY_DN4188_c0_g1_i1.p1  ORF type:complete len:103 (+),score=14.58 TRINITY_DN4188_c0_g1_i1:167-475(+)